MLSEKYPFQVYHYLSSQIVDISLAQKKILCIFHSFSIPIEHAMIRVGAKICVSLY